MWFTYVVIVALAWLAPAQGADDTKLVTIESGPVIGHKAPDSDVFVFYGIPYATGPTGRDRFRPPLPPPSWTQPLDAIDNTTACPQIIGAEASISYNDIKMQEDCLIANVYVTDTKETNLPVVAFVHGGAYQTGYGAHIPPVDFMTKKIKCVFITFNYRLGIHGFLSLGTKDIPGNAGLRDMLAFLRWVNRNVANFGGNPKDVTFMGDSAGSSAVDLLMLSKTTHGLFNKVIPNSGANTCVWSVQIDPLKNARRQGRTFNFTNVENLYVLEESYKNASIELLTTYNVAFETDSTVVFSPSVERYVGEEIILDDYPVNILKKGNYIKVPMLYGVTNMEGLIRVAIGYVQFKDKMNDKFSDFMPADLKFDCKWEKYKVARRVKKFYFGDKNVGDDTILGYINFFTDVLFAYPVWRAVNLHIKAGHDKVYLYQYCFVDGESHYPIKLENIGADHDSQTRLLFSTFENPLSDGNKIMRATVRELWINFIKIGKPVVNGSPLPEWTPTGFDGSPYMLLNSTSRFVQEPLLERRMRLWSDIYERHYRAPKPAQ